MDENFISPFQLEESLIRGRIVRMGSVLDDILRAHDYPDAVSKLTGEMVTLCALLSSMLKFDGIFTLQTQGDGAVRMLVADMVTGGNIRACATYEEEDFKGQISQEKPLLGAGHIAFTVDQGEFSERYQGIVELKPEGLVESVQHYFTQSEQIATGMMLAAGKVDGKWRSCGVMVQQMPGEAEAYNKDEDSLHEDDWRRTMVLLGSLKDEEMLSPTLSSNDLLFRLFHEEGIRVFEPQTLQKSCRCSDDRVKNVLNSLSKQELNDMLVDGKITMTCEFCSTHYEFNPDDFKGG